MKIKVKKYVYKNIASIFISRIDCTAHNILKLIEIFEFDNIMAIIDAKADLRPLFIEMKEKGIDCATEFNANNFPYTNVSLFSDLHEFAIMLNNAYKYTPEDMFFANFNASQWEQYLQNKTYFQDGKFVERNDSDLCISVKIDEFQTEITLNTQVYDMSVIVSKIKESFC